MVGLPRRGRHCPSLRRCLQADGASDSSHQARSRVGLWTRGLGKALRCCLPSLTGEMGAPSGPACAQGAGGCIRPNSVCVFQGLRRRLCRQQAARSRSGVITPPWASPAPAPEPSSAPVSSAGRSSPPGSCAPTGPGKNRADAVTTGPVSEEEDGGGSP